MANSNKAQKEIIRAVENQLKANSPANVRVTLDRLISLGISREESLKLIAAVLSVEILGAVKNPEEFNPTRYDNNLDKLPEMPW